jgi:hypothetical protein
MDKRGRYLVPCMALFSTAGRSMLVLWRMLADMVGLMEASLHARCKQAWELLHSFALPETLTVVFSSELDRV